MSFSAGRLARLGYTVIVPDLYWRIEPGADISGNDLDTAMDGGAATTGRANVQFERHPTGGHAFDNAWSEQFHQPRNAVTAWGITAPFLESTLPVG